MDILGFLFDFLQYTDPLFNLLCFELSIRFISAHFSIFFYLYVTSELFITGSSSSHVLKQNGFVKKNFGELTSATVPTKSLSLPIEHFSQ